MSDTGLMVLAAITVFIMISVMALAIAIPFFFGLHMLYESGSVATKVFMIILYVVLIFLFIKFRMYNVKLM